MKLKDTYTTDGRTQNRGFWNVVNIEKNQGMCEGWEYRFSKKQTRIRESRRYVLLKIMCNLNLHL